MISSLSAEKLMNVVSKVKVLVTLLLCVWLANISAKAFWMLVSPEPLPRVASETAFGQNQTANGSSPTYRMVSELLFGEAPKQQVVIEEQVVDAPKTRLRLRLLGVFVGQSPEGSTAIIAEQGKPNSEFYRVGDTVQNGVSLEQVHSDRVILNRSGRLEALYFDDAEDLFEAATQAPKTVAPSKPETNINNVDQFASAAKKQWKNNPLTALGAVGFEPVSPGQANGYRFSGQNPMMERYGIQKGDVIKSVNGIDVGDVNSDGDYLDQVFEQGQASILVERGSRQFEVTVPFR